LLRVLPRDFREAYQHPIKQLFDDQCHDALEEGISIFILFWIRMVVDCCRSAIREHWANHQRSVKASMLNFFKTPHISYRKVFITALLTSTAIYTIKTAFITSWYREVGEFQFRHRRVESPPSLHDVDVKKLLDRKLVEEALQNLAQNKVLCSKLKTRTGDPCFFLLKSFIQIKQSPDHLDLKLNVVANDPQIAAFIGGSIFEAVEDRVSLDLKAANDNKVDYALPLGLSGQLRRTAENVLLFERANIEVTASFINRDFPNPQPLGARQNSSTKLQAGGNRCVRRER
jgi:hypothetical protein